MSEEVKKSKEGSITSIKFQESVTPVNMTPEYVPLTKEAREQQRIQNEVALRKEWEKDREMVRGIFRNHECPGGMLSFPFYKYKWDQLKVYNLKDGEVYEIPRAVAKHLNTNCSYPTYNYKNNVQGMPEVTVAERVRRTSFQSLEFMDMDDPSMKQKMNIYNSGIASASKSLGSALPG